MWGKTEFAGDEMEEQNGSRGECEKNMSGRV